MVFSGRAHHVVVGPLKALGAALLGAIVGAVFTARVVATRDVGDTLVRQINKTGGRYVPARLHGDGTSYLFTPSPTGFAPSRATPLEIYDQEESGLLGWLGRQSIALKFRFAPRAPDGLTISLQDYSVGDWDGNGPREVVLSYAVGNDIPLSIPAVVRWLPDRGYAIAPILNEAQQIPRQPPSYYHDIYFSRTALQDPGALAGVGVEKPLSLSGYGADLALFEKLPHSQQRVMMTAYATERSGNTPTEFAVYIWQLDFGARGSQATRCHFFTKSTGTEDHLSVNVQATATTFAQAITDAVEANAKRVICI